MGIQLQTGTQVSGCQTDTIQLGDMASTERFPKVRPLSNFYNICEILNTPVLYINSANTKNT